MREGTGTLLRRAAAKAELQAREAAAALGAHIRSLPEAVRHHYLASAPLPPEAEEANEQRGCGNAQGEGGELPRSQSLSSPQLGLCGAETRATAIPSDDFVQPVGALLPTQGFPVLVHAPDAATGAMDAQPQEASIGGVHPDLQSLRDVIMRETDVEAIHALQPLPNGRALYVIETPFMTFPKFAVGSTNAANDDVRILATCGALWCAEEQFDEFLKRGGDL